MNTKRCKISKGTNKLSLLSLVPILFLLSCGNQDGDKIPEQKAASPKVRAEESSISATPYGTKEDIEQYLKQINPHVQEVGRIQLLVDKNIGSSGRATGSNLAPTMKSVKPNLEAILDSLSNISPPPLLSSFHGDFKKLVALRISAYDNTIRGFSVEKETGELSLYEEAEAQLDEANKLIVQLNEEMGKIMQTLSTASTQQAASP